MMTQQARLDLLIEAFEKFRSAILLYLLGLLIVIGASFSVLGVITSGFGTATIGAGAAAGIIVGGIILLVGIIMLFQSAGKFAEFDPDRLGGFRTGLRLQLAAIVLMILGMLAIFASPGLGAGLVVIALIAALVGEVLIGLFFMRLGDMGREGLPIPDGFRLVGILYLVGIIINILQLIAIIMAYVYAGDAIRRLQAARTSGGQPVEQGYATGF